METGRQVSSLSLGHLRTCRDSYLDISLTLISLPGGSADEESACNVGDLGLTTGLGRSPGEGKATHSSVLAWRIPWTL